MIIFNTNHHLPAATQLFYKNSSVNDTSLTLSPLSLMKHILLALASYRCVHPAGRSTRFSTLPASSSLDGLAEEQDAELSIASSDRLLLKSDCCLGKVLYCRYSSLPLSEVRSRLLNPTAVLRSMSMDESSS